MGTCGKCGLLIDNNCFVTGMNIEPKNSKLYQGCSYFIEPVFEDGKALEPERLLLLVENEIRKRK